MNSFVRFYFTNREATNNFIIDTAVDVFINLFIVLVYAEMKK